MRRSHARIESRAHVFHPVNSGGTTWLRESDLVFINKEPYAVFGWHGQRREIPDQCIPLNRKLLHHDHRNPAQYRYEDELKDPSTSHRLR